jgi:hypothetical protein
VRAKKNGEILKSSNGKKGGKKERNLIYVSYVCVSCVDISEMIVV